MRHAPREHLGSERTSAIHHSPSFGCARLGEVRQSVVFTGAAVAPLLQSQPPFPRVRPTIDVDAICPAASYTDVTKIEMLMALARPE
jgi:hypothetical protein